MSADYGFAPPEQRAPGQSVRCARCHLLQPLVSGRAWCASCGAPLQRWIAHPPPGGPMTPRRRPQRGRPYTGPPSYRGGHPNWAFPPVIWHDLPQESDPPLADPAPALRRASWLSAVTAVAAALAAGAESWRFVLLLQGRTLVLSGDTVRANDLLVAATGLAVVVAAVATFVVAVPALISTHAVAARRLGRTPSRRSASVIARLLVPVWNIYGAGQIVTEIDRMLVEGDRAEPTPRSRVTAIWWGSWIVSAVLVIAALARGLGGSLQAIADTVQLHVAVDVLAALVAALGVGMLRRFALLLTGRKNDLQGWVVQLPPPTRAVPPPNAAEPNAAERKAAEPTTARSAADAKAAGSTAADSPSG